jgi:phosphopentomutase
MPKRVVLIILDSVGIGELPDAHIYNDQGSNTLGNLAKALGGLALPNLESLGLGKLVDLRSPGNSQIIGSYGRMQERSPGKDTTTGHWEMAGIILARPFPVYPRGFPPELMREFEKRIGRKTLGNVAASGTEIIRQLGAEHIKTGFPIVYTSADSVFQIAGHEESFGLEELYRICGIARELLAGEHAVGRVIARPFTGAENDTFKRTTNRRDFSLVPPQPTVLDKLKENRLAVTGVGKIEDIFAGRGLTASFHIKNNEDGMDRLSLVLDQTRDTSGLIFANLIDFDMLYGHRNDVKGYAQALREVDRRLPQLFGQLLPEDLLVITADHGCDPTTASTDHSREYVPLLVYKPGIRGNVDLGTRSTFADVGQSIAAYFGLSPLPQGTNFLPEIGV